MKVLFYGSGAVGIAIAASVADSGWTVDIKASGSTADTIKARGIKRIGLFKPVEIPPEKITVYNTLSEIQNGDYDYILVCTKAITNEENALDLSNNRNLLKDGGKLVVFQNGWGNDEPYLKYFDNVTVCNARIITGFSRPERNTSEISVHSAPILLGNLHGNSPEPLKPLADAINNGGLPCEITRELQKALWAKVLYNCTLNPLGAILGVSYGKLTESPHSISIMDKVIEEIFEVLEASGYSTYWETAEEYKKVFYDDLIPNTYGHRSSTLQDIEKKIPTEIDAINGSVVRLGKKYGVDTPVNEMLVDIIKTIESYF